MYRAQKAQATSNTLTISRHLKVPTFSTSPHPEPLYKSRFLDMPPSSSKPSGSKPKPGQASKSTPESGINAASNVLGSTPGPPQISGYAPRSPSRALDPNKPALPDQSEQEGSARRKAEHLRAMQRTHANRKALARELTKTEKESQAESMRIDQGNKTADLGGPSRQLDSHRVSTYPTPDEEPLGETTAMGVGGDTMAVGVRTDRHAMWSRIHERRTRRENSTDQDANPYLNVLGGEMSMKKEVPPSEEDDESSPVVGTMRGRGGNRGRQASAHSDREPLDDTTHMSAGEGSAGTSEQAEKHSAWLKVAGRVIERKKSEEQADMRSDRNVLSSTKASKGKALLTKKSADRR